MESRNFIIKGINNYANLFEVAIVYMLINTITFTFSIVVFKNLFVVIFAMFILFATTIGLMMAIQFSKREKAPAKVSHLFYHILRPLFSLRILNKFVLPTFFLSLLFFFILYGALFYFDIHILQFINYDDYLLVQEIVNKTPFLMENNPQSFNLLLNISIVVAIIISILIFIILKRKNLFIVYLVTESYFMPFYAAEHYNRELVKEYKKPIIKFTIYYLASFLISSLIAIGAYILLGFKFNSNITSFALIAIFFLVYSLSIVIYYYNVATFYEVNRSKIKGMLKSDLTKRSFTTSRRINNILSNINQEEEKKEEQIFQESFTINYKPDAEDMKFISSIQYLSRNEIEEMLINLKNSEQTEKNKFKIMSLETFLKAQERFMQTGKGAGEFRMKQLQFEVPSEIDSNIIKQFLDQTSLMSVSEMEDLVKQLEKNTDLLSITKVKILNLLINEKR